MTLPRSTVLSRRTALALGGGAALTLAVGRRAHADGVTVHASDYGYDPVDSTAALQAALDSGADEVVIDNVGGEWITDPLFVTRDHQSIIIEPGVVLRAKPGSYLDLYDCLLTIENRTGVTLAGYGATLTMNKGEYTSGEWRHTLRVLSSSDITVEGLILERSGGDGIYLGVSTVTGSPQRNSNVTITNVLCTGHRRNALSVISVDGLLVTHSRFTNSSGTSPQAGIDLEPNSSLQQLSNVVIRDCYITSNRTRGVMVHQGKLRSTSAPTSILLHRVSVDRQAGSSPAVSLWGRGDDDPVGVLEVRDCFIARDSSGVSGTVGVFNKSAEGTHLLMNRVCLEDMNTSADTYPPITVSDTKPDGSGIPPAEYGGMTFNDVALVTSHHDPFLAAWESTGTSGLANVHGNLTVIAPVAASTSDVTQDLGSLPHDVDHAVSPRLTAPATTVALAASTSTVNVGDTIVLTFSRASADVSLPLAVRFYGEGTAVERFDYAGLARVAVIAPGAISTTVSIPTRRTQAGAYTVTGVYKIASSISYTFGSTTSASVIIQG